MAGSEVSPSALVDFVAGTAGGIASLLAGHPFDTVKTRLQAQASSSTSSTLAASISIPQHAATSTEIGTSTRASASVSPGAGACTGVASSKLVPVTSASIAQNVYIPNAAVGLRDGTMLTVGGSGGRMTTMTLPVYRSATDAFRLIVRQERIWGLYKGITSPMLGVALMNASIFGLYNVSLGMQKSHHILETYPLAQVFLAGMLSGVGSSLLTSPIELVKIRQQMDPNSALQGIQGKGATWRVFVSILRTEGFFHGIYRGWSATAIRDLGYGPYFASYEWLNSQIRSYTGRPLSNVDLATSGAIAGVLAWLSTFWADVIKTQIQATSNNTTLAQMHKKTSSSLFWKTAKQTYTHAGWKAFFVGVGPTVLRALPVNAVLFVTYELTKDYLISLGY